MKPVWIVDDDASIRWVLERALRRAELPCRLFENAQDVMKALQAEDVPQVLVSDIRMPGDNGLELLEQVKARLPELPVIIMTGFSDLDSAVSAFQGGAYEYLPKPFDIDEATALILKACQRGQGAAGAEAPKSTAVLEMLGQAPAMQEVFRAIGRLSQSTATVLITGESGTGKEVVAQALHRHSPRADRAFVALNTAAIPKDLLESELFGHERGSFTGAQAQRRGRFEQAEGGTLFLDEIGDMPLDLQTRLLRILSDGQYYRVGGHQPLKANVRVIAATHQDLERRVADGKFREDLFHRLNVIRLRLPPLRERADDIPDLARHFLERSARQLGSEVRRLSPSAMDALSHHPFPGNVRQLENLCHWLTVMAPSPRVELDDLPPEFRERGPQPLKPTEQSIEAQTSAVSISRSQADEALWIEPLVQAVAQAIQAAQRDPSRASEAEMAHWERLFETAVYGTALRLTRGRRLEAAQVLQVGRNTITRKIQTLGLEAE
ncbi:MAG: nitrogen regulation protein NR(I) [Burkholderiaceae bacterium]|jgi:two-component system nitrogen regulation response regulator GlnG